MKLTMVAGFDVSDKREQGKGLEGFLDRVMEERNGRHSTTCPSARPW
jgi:hypothetical protein